MDYFKKCVFLLFLILGCQVSLLAECTPATTAALNNFSSAKAESSCFPWTTANESAFSTMTLLTLESQLLTIRPIDLYASTLPLQVVNGLPSDFSISQPNRALHKNLPEKYIALPAAYGSNLQPLLVNVIVNKSVKTEAPILTYSNDKTVCFSDEELIAMKLINSSKVFYEYFEANSDPLHEHSLKCAVNGQQGVNLVVDPATGSVTIVMPLVALQTQNINLGLNNEPIYPTNPTFGNYTAYQLAYNQNTNLGIGNLNGMGTFVNTTATPVGSLMNGFSGGNQNPVTRNYSYWQTDFPAAMTSLVVGDSTQQIGAWGGTFNYAGIQYGSNPLLRPGYFFTATPIINGSVNAPSTAEVLLNGGPVTTTNLAPGSFNLYNLPIINGDGTITVNIKNPDGNTYQSVNLPYYTNPKVLQDTTYLYQYNVGIPRTSAANGWNLNYQTTTPGISTQQFIGITNQYTMELHAEAQVGNFANLGMSHNLIWLNAFATSLSAAVGGGESGTGGLLGFNISRQASLPNSIGFGYSANLQSANFQMFGQAPNQGQQLQQTVFVNYLSPFGMSIAAGYVNNATTNNGTSSIYNATLSWQFLRNFILTSTTSLNNAAGMQSWGSNLNLNINLDSSQSINSGYSYSDNSGQVSSTALVNYQYLSPSNLWGGTVQTAYATGGSGTPTSLSGNGYYMFKNFNVNAQGGYVDNSNYSYGGNVAGNLVLSKSGMSLGQYSTLSFIVVQVGHLPNIGIKQNGSIVGSTDRNGSFVIPNVTPYLSQNIEVNALDLPFNTELDSYAKRVVAPLNGGTTVVFVSVSFVPAFVKISYNGGQIPPTGYEAKLYNRDGHKLIESDYVIDGGTVQLAKFSRELHYELEFTVKDGTFSCPIDAENIKDDSNQYLYNLGAVSCVKK